MEFFSLNYIAQIFQEKKFSLIRSYLQNRSQVISINDYLSSVKKIYSGVTQDSFFEPLFFLVFINDLPRYCEKMTALLLTDGPKHVSKKRIFLKFCQNKTKSFIGLLKITSCLSFLANASI